MDLYKYLIKAVLALHSGQRSTGVYTAPSAIKHALLNLVGTN